MTTATTFFWRDIANGERTSIKIVLPTNKTIEQFSDAIKQDQNRLREAYLSKSGFGSSGLRSLSESLMNPSNKLVVLSLSNLRISNHGCKYLAKALANDACLLETL